ncbi:MAG: methylmalonyl-CoA carboxyltransferase, partial [Williamsia herbipolensis]|nr:methylmalonyl-CoA carboxyltransferase [Williamsia herbipolensis]MBE7161555.1 methylmalonyl-CoA carboxyltransferase [Williamsia herbipolensis]
NPGLEPEVTDSDRLLDDFLPDNDNAGYDMRDILIRIFDDGAFHEVSEIFAPNIITGYARVDGRAVGVVANQPSVMAGVLDTDSSEKATRFVRICNAFNIPLVFVVDTPGILPGVAEEAKGTIRRSGKFLFAYVEADVPKVTVVVRKAYGGAYAVMGCKQLGADINFAWPTAKIAVMGAESAAAILTRRQTENATPHEADKIRTDFINFYNTMMATPYLAAERGYVDAVIEPSQTRLQLRKALAQLRDKDTFRTPRKSLLMPV